jgi:hypothetical protein
LPATASLWQRGGAQASTVQRPQRSAVTGWRRAGSDGAQPGRASALAATTFSFSSGFEHQ